MNINLVIIPTPISVVTHRVSILHIISSMSLATCLDREVQGSAPHPQTEVDIDA